jgi:hypothetical protein
MGGLVERERLLRELIGVLAELLAAEEGVCVELTHREGESSGLAALRLAPVEPAARSFLAPPTPPRGPGRVVRPG